MKNPRRVTTFTAVLIEDRVIRRMISAMLALLVPAAYGQESIANKIAAIPEGAKIELHMKNSQTMRGGRGPVANAAFTLVDARKGDHQIAFDDVASVKQLKSHTTRNILIVVAIGVAAIGITIGILLRCGPLGCGRTAI
ncbi:MAG TPA: hypothetical protein VKR43_07795 [Bryobacteraceae bacterium]|nr:hypothetical protein [Bryobacteraceae bacterium]